MPSLSRRIAWTLLGAALLVTEASADKVGTLVDRALRHDNYKVRLKAAAGLGKVKDPRAKETLVAVLGDPNALVRAAAANALGQIGDASVTQSLCKLRNDPDAFVARTVLGVLAGKFGGIKACTARKIYLEVTVSGGAEAYHEFVQQKILEEAAKDPRVVLGKAVDVEGGSEGPDPKAEVMAGKMPGVELKVNVSNNVNRGAASVQISCQLAQAIFDLKLRALRANATQRAAIDLGSTNVTDQAIDGNTRECLAALAPVVYEGLGGYLDRVQ